MTEGLLGSAHRAVGQHPVRTLGLHLHLLFLLQLQYGSSSCALSGCRTPKLSKEEGRLRLLHRCLLFLQHSMRLKQTRMNTLKVQLVCDNCKSIAYLRASCCLLMNFQHLYLSQQLFVDLLLLLLWVLLLNLVHLVGVI